MDEAVPGTEATPVLRCPAHVVSKRMEAVPRMSDRSFMMIVGAGMMALADDAKQQGHDGGHQRGNTGNART